MERWQYTDAFVIQFRPGADVGAGKCEGKVEHVASYEATRFRSLAELLDFMARRLAETRDAAQE